MNQPGVARGGDLIKLCESALPRRIDCLNRITYPVGLFDYVETKRRRAAQIQQHVRRATEVGRADEVPARTILCDQLRQLSEPLEQGMVVAQLPIGGIRPVVVDKRVRPSRVGAELDCATQQATQ
ncbi:MAG: hypothetical protein WCH84_04175 [Verrucomicrobiota bacterium]